MKAKVSVWSKLENSTLFRASHRACVLTYSEYVIHIPWTVLKSRCLDQFIFFRVPLIMHSEVFH